MREDMPLLLEILLNCQGYDAFIKINETFLKTGIKPIEKPIIQLKKIYVYQNHNNKTVPQLARKVNIDERVIMKWLQNSGIKKNGKRDAKTGDLFDG